MLVVVTALPAIHRDLGASLASLQCQCQRFGGAFGVAVATSVFAAFGSLGSPTAFIAGFRPSFTMVAGLAVLGALAAFGVGDFRRRDDRSEFSAVHAEGGAR